MFKKLVLLATCILLPPLAGQAYADPSAAMASRFPYNLVLKAEATVAFTLGNVRAPSSSELAQEASCRILTGKVRFFGTEDGDTFDSTAGAGGALTAKKLVFLDEVPFSLARGEVLPISFKQPFTGTQSVIIETRGRAGSTRCLATSSATVARTEGDIIGLVLSPTEGWDLIGLVDLDSPSPGPRCFPCVPVCACGTE